MNRLLPSLLGAVVVIAVAAVARADIPPMPPPVPDPPAPAPETPPEPPAEEAFTGTHTFSLDAKKSSFVVQVFKKGAASALAHDHVVRASTMQGSITVDVADPTTAKIDITIDTAGLINDEPSLRKRYGLEGTLSDGDRKEVLANMQNKEQLDVKNHPKMTFVSTGLTRGQGNKLVLKGNLTIKGKSKEIAMPIDVKLSGKTIEGKGTVGIKTSDFGIEPYSAFLGAVGNKDELILHVRLVATAP